MRLALTLQELTDFIKEYGTGWEKELLNFEKFDRSVSNEIAEFPYAKIFKWIEEEKININPVDEGAVTLKTFSEDVQIQFEKLSFSLGEMLKTDAFIDVTKIIWRWNELEMHIYYNLGKTYWLFTKFSYWTPRLGSLVILCCNDKLGLCNLFKRYPNIGKHYIISNAFEVH